MRALTRAIALAGGLIACAIAALVTTSVLMRWLHGLPINGDFEMVQMGTAIAVFCSLPFCQAGRANIVVDTFTTRLSERARARIDAFWDVVYAIAMAAIGYAMLSGVADAWRSGEETMASRIPLWPALAISTGLVLFLALVALWTAARLSRSAR